MTILLLVLALLPAEAEATAFTALRQDSTGVLHRVERSASHLFVVTHKSGLLSFLGHEHAIIPEAWTGELCSVGAAEPGSHGSIVLQTGSLVIDSDSARSLAGLGDGPGEGDVKEIQETLLDPDHLDAREHPEIRLKTAVMGFGEGSRLDVRTELTVRGRTHAFEHPLTVEALENGGLRVTGSLGVRQTDYGIEPASVAGVVNVADEVDLHVVLVTTPTDRTCSVSGRGSGDLYRTTTTPVIPASSWGTQKYR